MPTREERQATLRVANQRRQERKRAAVDDALRSMLRRNEPVSVAAVAKKAGVSRNFLYSHEELLRRVGEAGSSRMAQPSARPSSEASLRNRLANALDALREANAENKRLQAQIERLTGELAREIAQRPAQRVRA